MKTPKISPYAITVHSAKAPWPPCPAALAIPPTAVEEVKRNYELAKGKPIIVGSPIPNDGARLPIRCDSDLLWPIIFDENSAQRYQEAGFDYSQMDHGFICRHCLDLGD